MEVVAKKKVGVTSDIGMSSGDAWRLMKILSSFQTQNRVSQRRDIFFVVHRHNCCWLTIIATQRQQQMRWQCNNVSFFLVIYLISLAITWQPQWLMLPPRHQRLLSYHQAPDLISGIAVSDNRPKLGRKIATGVQLLDWPRFGSEHL
jgi:hypothetical protein